jgi:tRNA(Ile)-lysidine synthase
VTAALERLGGGPAVPLSELRKEPPGLARLVLRALAERAAGGSRSLSRAEADAIMALGEAGGTRSLDLGQGLRAVVEYGTLRFTRTADAAPPEPVELTVPGRARFGQWEVVAGHGPGDVAVSGEAVGPALLVRSWRDGDRMRPVGLGGTKTLQDLFTDRKVPRALRRTLPVVEAAGEIVWVAGVALDERFAAGESDRVSLSARSLR